ncbi:MAG: tRNA epoxyqueuosine(34) reductase QueG [Chitinophagales bacterium]
MNISALSSEIKNRAKLLGFSGCGFAKAAAMPEEERYLQQWLNQGKHGEMHYMSNYQQQRTDPTVLVPGAKTVISLSYNYYTEYQQAPDAPKLAMYALGADYHEVIKRKLHALLDQIRGLTPVGAARCFVDSAPVLERAWAQRAGVGWIGKNTLVLTKRAGSYFFLAEIILDVELEYDSPVKDYCGNCTRCIDACPTQALSPYQMDASKCVSYLTIEYRGEEIPEAFKGKMGGYMFGCDICQQVCPINSQATEHQEPEFNPSKELLQMARNDWQELSEQQFRILFKNSAVKRTKFQGLKRNIDFLKD